MRPCNSLGAIVYEVFYLHDTLKLIFWDFFRDIHFWKFLYLPLLARQQEVLLWSFGWMPCSIDLLILIQWFLRSKTLHFPVQWSLYFKATHGTKKMWSYIAGGPKIKGLLTQKIVLWDQIKWSYNQGWS